MANHGIHFPQAVAGSPLCSPFRGSLLTSRYPHEAVHTHNFPMPKGMPTIAQPFNEGGYDTAWFGKWHVDGTATGPDHGRTVTVPHDRRGGFGTWLGYECNNGAWEVWVHGHDGNKEVPCYRLPGFETDSLTDLLMDYIRQRAPVNDARDGKGRALATRPFFAALSVQPPHDPYVAPRQFMARHNAANIKLRPNVPDIPRITDRCRPALAGYYAMIENLDDNVGRILDLLCQTGLDRTTFVLFFSDHGDMHGSHGRFAKHMPHAESLHIPMLILGPRHDCRMGPVDAPINHVDIAPTSLGLANLPIPIWMRGYDFSNLVRNDRPMPTDMPQSAYCQIVRSCPGLGGPWRGIVTADGWKYAVTSAAPWLMFNTREDPFEQTNLVFDPQFTARREQLHTELARWIQQVDDPFELPKL
jgi:arylsulfatase A-like enzyme